jgi:hypothetical protein
MTAVVVWFRSISEEEKRREEQRKAEKYTSRTMQTQSRLHLVRTCGEKGITNKIGVSRVWIVA